MSVTLNGFVQTFPHYVEPLQIGVCHCHGSYRHVNDDSPLSIMFYVAELVTELELKTDSDWSRWTLQELE